MYNRVVTLHVHTYNIAWCEIASHNALEWTVEYSLEREATTDRQPYKWPEQTKLLMFGPKYNEVLRVFPHCIDTCVWSVYRLYYMLYRYV